MLKSVFEQQHKWIWFLSTLVLGAAPIMVSFLLALNNARPDWLNFYKIEDMIFWGIAMCISNFTLVSGKKANETKELIILISAIMVLLLSVCLGIIQTANSVENAFKVAAHILVMFCIGLSLTANNFVFNTVFTNKRK